MIKKAAISVVILVFLSLAIYSFRYSKTASQEAFVSDQLIQDNVTLFRNLGEQEDQERDNPRAAAEDRFERTKDIRLGYPPSGRKVEAYQQIQDWQNGQNEKRASIPNVQWTERGPNNVGGRTRALMFDPNDPTSKKVWAGSTGGGLWYTNDITNPSIRWKQAEGIMTNLAVSSIAYDPSNPQVFYLGTGLGYTSDIQGSGIWKSTDAGDTWSQLGSTDNGDFHFVQKIVVTQNGTVFASTLNGLMGSLNGGSRWFRALPGRMGDIEIASNGTIYATSGVNSFGQIYKSVDNGDSWESISPPNQVARIELASSPSNPSIIYAVAQRAIDINDPRRDIAYFSKSTNGGENWVNITIPDYVFPFGERACETNPQESFTRGQAFFNLILNVHPEDENIVFAGGINMVKSINGGQTWETISDWFGGGCDDYVHADQHAIVTRPGFPNEIIVGNDGGVYYSKDAGNSKNPDFDDRNFGYNTVLFYSVAMRNELNSNRYLAGAQDNGTQVFSTPGINATFDLFGGDGTFCFIDQDNPDIAIISVPNNNYFLSLDGGKTIAEQLINDNGRGRFINPAAYDSKSNTLYTAGEENELYRVQNIGSTPNAPELLNLPLNDGQVSAIAVSPHTENTIFVATTSGVFRINNASNETPTVTDITGVFDGERGAFISCIAVGETENQLLVTSSNYGAVSVFETLDGGDNWINKEDNLPDIPVNWALYNPNNYEQVMLATEMGVWSTNSINADNPNWRPTNSGLATVRTDMLQYRESDETVVAATYGRGLFTTDAFATTIDADFKTEQVISYVDVPLKFEDASLLPNDSWAWNFGDGGTSNEQNPSYSYSAPGTYDVTLTIDNGNSTETKTGYVTVLPVRSAPFGLADGGNFESNQSDFTSRALLNNIDIWELGIPSNRLSATSSGTNAWKTDLDNNLNDIGQVYSSALYTPAFDLSNENRDYTIRFKKSIEGSFCNGPYALQLQYSIDGGANWFRLGSSNSKEEFGTVNWYNRADATGCAIATSVFPDGEGWNAVVLPHSDIDLSVDNEETQLKINFFAGQPNVGFRFVAAVGTGFTTYDRDGFMIDDFELLAETPKSKFESRNTVTYINAPVQFTFLSHGATSYLWDFGDGNTSTLENPTHRYQTSGKFDVTLTIDGTTSTTLSNYLSVLPDLATPYLLSDGGDFESNTDHFVAQNIAGTGFELGNSNVSGKDGTTSGSMAWVTGINTDFYDSNSVSILYTPNFLSKGIGSYILTFKSKFSLESGKDGFIVQYSTDKGASWSTLVNQVTSGWYNQLSHQGSPFGDNKPIFSGNTNGEFQMYTPSLHFLAEDHTTASFRFLFLSNSSGSDAGLTIDDFQIIYIPPSPSPAVPDFDFTSGSGCSGHSVTFTNSSVGTITDFAWDFGQNAIPRTATGEGPHTVAYIEEGTSSVSLTVTSPANGVTVEEKLNIITTIPDFTPTFTQEEDLSNRTTVLTASEGDSYQWFTVGNTPIQGATNQTYIADETGVYRVAVTIGGCTRESSIAQIITSTEDDLAFEKNVSVYPNPTDGIFKVNVSDAVIGELTLNIFDNVGNTILSKSVSKSTFEEEYEVNIASVKSGVYLVEVVSNKAKTIKRIIKK